MKFGPAPLADCEGAILAHSLLIDGKRLPKGRRLTADDLATARAAGLTELVVARLEPGDIAEDDAAARLGAALAGGHVKALAPVHGRVNLVAMVDGLVRLDPAAVHRLNAIDEGITLGVQMPEARVRDGDIVATIKIIPYAVPGAAVDAALAAAAPIAVAPFRAATVALIQTMLPGQPDKLFAKTEEVTRRRLAAIGATLVSATRCPHAVDDLTAKLAATDADLILIAGASATADRRDVVPAAIEVAGGAIERLGMPVDPGNLLCLASLAGKSVLGLPGCARSPKRNGVDLVLERLLTGLPVDSAIIAGMGVGGVLAEVERPEPRAGKPAVNGPVGAVVLAAGRSSRMQGANKLLADLGGKPLLAHTLDTLAAAGLPALVVVGNMAAEMRAVVGDRAAIVEAPDFAEGLSRSLRAGIAAVPADWRAAIVCLGDMPQVTPAVLTALAAPAREPQAIVVPTVDGKRGNPVLWPRAHFARLAALDGDVGGKVLLAELADQVIEVEVGTDAILADIDTPEALAAARARQGNSS
ncbi:NTP transferase domain-containing protein [Sphingoaurantiacus capsulatus]|uniref:NTP transferase domain-containing protein n=1 Tax=Sphingoaurantiacus capsulatus TaxID=1771310 RepID=A0ABV7XBF4_9SPHN